MGRLRTTLMVVCVLTSVMKTAASDGPPGHLRGLDPYARWLIDSALLRSSTVRQLAVRLDASDVIAYVQIVAIPARTARTALINGDGPMRYLLVSLHRAETPDRLIELLGHELQHVSEIAAAPHVRDDRALGELYRRIGMSLIASNRFETVAAQLVARRVRRELAASPDRPYARRFR